MSAPNVPGIYRNLDFDEYAAIPAINFSILSKFKDTPAHAQVGILHERESTPTQRRGQLVHMAILEPERLKSSLVVRPKLNRRTKLGKLAWAAFEREHAADEIASEDEVKLCAGLVQSVMRHATAREILYADGGASELTIVWLDPETGVLCKSRIDRIGPLGTEAVVVDVKTVSEAASLRNWQRSIANYCYAEQAAMYLEGLATLIPVPQPGARKFLWLVAEVDPPYLVRLFEAEYDALQYGYAQFREHLKMYAHCKETGDWPGWPEGVEVAGLPAWMQKTFDASL